MSTILSPVMSIPVQKFREFVFQALYSHEVSADPKPFLETLLRGNRKDIEMAVGRMNAVMEKKDEIDLKVAQISEKFDYEKISPIERNVLRLAVYEIFYDDSIPPKVAIAEAIRIIRKYGSHEGGTYVNALLDRIYQESLK